MSKEDRVDALGKILCRSCGSVLPQIREVHVRILEDQPDGVLNFLFGPGITVIRRDFLSSFGEHEVQSDLYLGNLYGPDGKLLKNWVTARGRCGVVIRGAENVAHRVCPTCLRHYYFATGREYLYPSPPKDVSILECRNSELVVTESVKERVTVTVHLIDRARPRA